MYKFHKVKIKNIQQETNDAVIWTLDVPEYYKGTFIWHAGQHLTFKKMIDGEEIRRSYSILSATKSDEIKILIKKIVDGKFSQAAQSEYEIGQTIEVMPPTGHFSLSSQNDKTYAFFAAGSGITPIMSMIYEVLYNSNSQINLYYGNSTVESTLLKRQLTDLKDEFQQRLSISYFLSQEPIDIALFSGRIDKDKVNKIFDKELKNLDVVGYYLCGPGGMIDEVSKVLMENNVSSKIIHSEQFLSEGQVITDKQKTAKVDSGVMVTIDGVTSHYEIKEGEEKTLLDAALDAKIKMPYSCKAGVCATCRCKLREGQVEMINNYSLEDWELEKGYILSCQSIPKTKKISIDYDC
ncbi:MAG: 2Fe-2S iron-sulfur cluster binding domain-containing protein [Alcanivoracaceae bacterium]|nr:2Fe-2S iron-sulfur cluster binding domain-containing protein [Alcanivoracaceae bacterium]